MGGTQWVDVTFSTMVVSATHFRLIFCSSQAAAVAPALSTRAANGAKLGGYCAGGRRE
jgi:hypothetical protein